MKIKTKKQLNLPQLIEWAWDNPNLSNGISFLSNGSESIRINFRFNPRGVLNLDVLNGNNISNDVQFTLEVEEEITEDTEIKTLVEVTEFGNIHVHIEATVKEEKRNSSLEFHALLNGRLVLIWTQDKGLVE